MNSATALMTSYRYLRIRHLASTNALTMNSATALMTSYRYLRIRHLASTNGLRNVGLSYSRMLGKGSALFNTVRCAFFDRVLLSRMPLDSTHVAGREHVCAQWHSFLVTSPRTGSRCCILRPNTEGTQCWRQVRIASYHEPCHTLLNGLKIHSFGDKGGLRLIMNSGTRC
jgi:hypothetical protein